MELRLSSIVVLGEGFTPHLIGPKTLESVFGDQARPVIVSQPITIIEYPAERYQVLVQGDRIDVQHQRPPTGVDEAMQQAIMELLRLWPLIRPNAVGVNFALGDTYGERLTQEALISRMTPRVDIEAIFETQLLGSKHSFVFSAEPAKLTVQITTDAMVAERPGFIVDCNANHQPVTDVEQIVRSQGAWYDKISRWSEALIYGR